MMDKGLRLTRPFPEDAECIAAAMSDWQTARWLTAVPWPYGVQDARAFIASAGLDEHAVRLGDKLVGMVRAGSSFGIWIMPDHRGSGLALRAGMLALSRHFLSDPSDMTAQYLSGNARSAGLLQRLGFETPIPARLWSVAMDKEMPATTLTLRRARFAALHPIRLTTPHLRIDPLGPADLAQLERIIALPEVSRMIPGGSPAKASDVMPDGAETGLFPPLGLAVRHEGRVAGAIFLSEGPGHRLRYVLHPDLAGRGLGQEMVAAVFDELIARFALPEIVADAFLDNLPARNILKNLGFRRADDSAMTAPGRDGPAAAALYRWRPALI